MNDNMKINGPLKSQTNNNGKSVLVTEPVIGIVKDNIDANRTGEIKVYIPNFGSLNVDDSSSWTPVKYAMPYYGLTKPTSSGDSYGDFVGNSHSYGMWFPAPDIGTQVLCIFVDGSPEKGYYIGCIPDPNALQMVPAIGAVGGVVLNDGEAASYGASPRLPTTNINTNDANKTSSNGFLKEGKPLHSYHAATFNRQGILRDTSRGPISSSAQRESPSRVAGISTPGRPIYEGGVKDDEVRTKASSGDKASLKLIGRRGGHTFVMDDGDIEGKDQLVRLRSSNGHQIMMNDSSEVFSIMHSNGMSYIEFGKEGTVDIYGTNSVNIRTQGDLNLHADRNINLNAKEQINMNSKNMFVNTDESTIFRAGTTFASYAIGNYTIKTDASYSVKSSGNASMNSDAIAYVNGKSRINLNTGSTNVIPEKIKPPVLVAHSDTVYDSEKGYLASPGKLPSIVTRAPTHFPWDSANKGVSISIKLDAEPVSDEAPALSDNTSDAPITGTSPALVSTVSPSVKSPIGEASKAVVSQMAVNAANGPAAAAVAAGKGIVETAQGKLPVVGALAQTPAELGSLVKPGMDVAIQKAVNSGVTDIEKAMPSAVFSGKDGINSIASLTKDTTAATTALTDSLQQSKDKLLSSGVLKGNETSTSGATGLILAGAVMGVGNVIKSVGLNSSSLSPINNTIGNNLKSLATGVTDISNKLGESVSSATSSISGALSGAGIAGGLTGAAAGLTGAAAGAAKNALGGISAKLGVPSVDGALASLKGSMGSLSKAGDFAAKTAQSIASSMESASKKIFDSIKNSIPKLPSGKLIDLSGPENKLKEAADASKGALSSVADSAKGLMNGIKLPNALSGENPLSSITNATNDATKGLTGMVNSMKDSIPNVSDINSGLGGISKTLSSVSGAASGAIGGAVGGAVSGAIGGAVGKAVSGAIGGVAGGVVGKAVSGVVSGVVGNAAGALTAGISSVSSSLGQASVAVNDAQQALGAAGKLTDKVSASLKDAKSLIDGKISGALDKLPKLPPPSLDKMAKDLMGAKAAELENALKSFGDGVKLPIIGSGTIKLDALKEQSVKLLGNAKIPTLPSGKDNSFKW